MNHFKGDWCYNEEHTKDQRDVPAVITGEQNFIP